MGRVLAFSLLLLLPLAFGCGAKRPVLYPNETLERVGPSAAERDVDECMRRAEQYVKSGGGGATGDIAAGTAVGAGTGAAIGAVGGAVSGDAGHGAAVGAATGATAGFLGGVFGAMRGRSDPSPVFASFVDRCLREKGYEPIGWE